MKIKRILLMTLTLVIMLSICLTGCKKNNTTNVNDDDEPPIIQAYNEKIKSKVKGTGVGYWKTGDNEKYTIFTLEQQEEYLINENYLNGKMFFASSESNQVFNTTVTYDDETVWAFSDLEITFSVNENKMTLNVGDKQYVLDKVTLNDISDIRNKLVSKLEKEKEEEENNNNVIPSETPSKIDIEITTSTYNDVTSSNKPSENPLVVPSATPSQNTQEN